MAMMEGDIQRNYTMPAYILHKGRRFSKEDYQPDLLSDVLENILMEINFQIPAKD